jgi:DNA repair exonuclease SbcCD ATPase subunit
MLAGHVLLLLLAANDPADVSPAQARAELEVCAGRIEELKARNERGAELNRLLRRAQELAAQLERAETAEAPAVHPDGPSPEELRERADAARDEADRLAAEMAALDVKIQDARRSRGEPEAGLQKAALGAVVVAPAADRVRALQGQREVVAERRARAEAEAAALEAEARDLERTR